MCLSSFISQHSQEEIVITSSVKQTFAHMCDQSGHTLEPWIIGFMHYNCHQHFQILLLKERVISQQHFDFILVDFLQNIVGQAQIIFTTNKDSRVWKKRKTPPSQQQTKHSPPNKSIKDLSWSSLCTQGKCQEMQLQVTSKLALLYLKTWIFFLWTCISKKEWIEKQDWKKCQSCTWFQNRFNPDPKRPFTLTFRWGGKVRKCFVCVCVCVIYPSLINQSKMKQNISIKTAHSSQTWILWDTTEIPGLMWYYACCHTSDSTVHAFFLPANMKFLLH